VSWSKVFFPNSEGGLGIRNLMLRYGLDREDWWRVAMDSKFGSLWGGWCSRVYRSLWGGVVEEYQERVR
jgi:hypothetical protein